MKEKISKLINEVLHSHQLPGVAVGIVLDGQPFFAAGFGYRNIESKEPIMETSLFHLASISKLFVATAIMQLAEQGKLSLEDSLDHFLPYLKIENPFDSKITIKHLLSHSAGFPDITNYHWDEPEHDDGALERYVRQLDFRLLSPPGKKFFYSNIAFEVLGHLVSKIAEMPFEEFINKNILEPLGMSTSTHFRWMVSPDLAVSPHINDLTTHLSEIYPYHRAHSPSSTLHSSASEMNLWAMANLKRGYSANTLFLHPSAYDHMWKPMMPVEKVGRPDKYVGLGWFLDKHRGLSTVYHSGQDVGFSTYFVLIPERNIGVTVLCNTTPAPAEKIAYTLLDILIGHEPDPIKPPVIIPLGEVYRQGGVSAMRKLYNTLKTTYPTKYDFGASGFLDRSSTLLDSDRNSEAMDILQFALELFPNNATGYGLFARANFQEGDMEQALKCAMRSLEIEPNNVFLRQQIQPFLDQ